MSLGEFFGLLMLLSLLGLVIGLIKPNLVLWWGKRTRGEVIKYYGGFLFLFSILVVFAEVLFTLIAWLALLGLIIGLIKPEWVIKWGEKKTQEQVIKYYGGLLVISFLIISIIQPFTLSQDSIATPSETAQPSTPKLTNTPILTPTPLSTPTPTPSPTPTPTKKLTFEDKLKNEIKTSWVDIETIEYYSETKHVNVWFVMETAWDDEHLRDSFCYASFDIMDTLVKYSDKIDTVTLIGKTTLIDPQGNEEIAKVFQAKTTMEKAKNVKWKNLAELGTLKPLYDNFDNIWWHMAVRPTPTPTPTPETKEKLELLSSNSYVDSVGYLHIVGEVKYEGELNANYIEIIATLYKNGEVVDTSFTYTELDILKDGEKSPFEIIFLEPVKMDNYKLQAQYRLTTQEPYRGIKVTSHKGYYDSVGYYRIVGEVKNTGDCTASYAQIIATLYNSKNEVIGTSFTYSQIETLDSGQTSPFEIIVLELPKKIDHYELVTQAGCTS